MDKGEHKIYFIVRVPFGVLDYTEKTVCDLSTRIVLTVPVLNC